MEKPLPESKGERQRVPPKKPTAIGLLEPGSSGSFPWRLVLLISAVILVAAGAFYLGLR